MAKSYQDEAPVPSSPPKDTDTYEFRKNVRKQTARDRMIEDDMPVDPIGRVRESTAEKAGRFDY